VNIRVLAATKEDLREGYWFYEKQEPGIGDYFLDSISADIDSLQLHHGYHRQFDGFHRLIAKVFPFCIYYRVAGDDILVDAVLDQRRNPQSIRRLLRRRNRSD
jgi:plasmid stabilization system protein ParE